MMRIWRTCFIGAYLGLSGCVIGYGPCLFQQPVKNNLTDRTAYVYAPAQSHLCLPANDVQLVGVSEFPQNVIENSHVSVDGVLFQAGSGRQHTPFVMNVTTILPMAATH
jgi:hypothetical protein